jgi:hypothetical protein
MKGAEKKQKASPAIMVNTYSAIRYGQNENGVTRKQLRQMSQNGRAELRRDLRLRRWRI